jgi:hypothetical protein
MLKLVDLRHIGIKINSIYHVDHGFIVAIFYLVRIPVKTTTYIYDKATIENYSKPATGSY